MRILFVSTNLPVPPNNGQAIRSLSIIRALASSGHELTFVSFATRSFHESFHPLSSYCREIQVVEQELMNLSKDSDYFRRIGCMLSLEPYSVERFRSEPMRARIQTQLRATPFALIVCDSLYALVNVPETNIPIALNCHNVEHVIFKRYSRIERNFLKKYYARAEAHLMRAAERSSCHRAAVAMVCSKDDRDILHQLRVDLPIFVVPNAVDTDSFRPDRNHNCSNTETLLFQGSMDWFPNRDAVEFFARAILPLVRAECPDVKFIVAGRNPPPGFVTKLSADNGIEFTGTVPDMLPYLHAATVVVVPLRLGGGTRIKILEAGATGKPIVSTSVGAEGLELEAEKQIILADDPSEFASSVVTLLRDPARRDAIARSARAVIVERYGHLALKQSLDTLISSFPPDGLRDLREASR
jgi:polysaccharide biosynthesis protein PslH